MSADRDRLLSIAKAAINATVRNTSSLFNVVKGFLTSLHLMKAWHEEMIRLLKTGYLAPTQAMVRLIRQKGKYAAC